jgi:hypothetical protein
MIKMFLYVQIFETILKKESRERSRERKNEYKKDIVIIILGPIITFLIVLILYYEELIKFELHYLEIALLEFMGTIVALLVDLIRRIIHQTRLVDELHEYEDARETINDVDDIIRRRKKLEPIKSEYRRFRDELTEMIAKHGTSPIMHKLIQEELDSFRDCMNSDEITVRRDFISYRLKTAIENTQECVIAVMLSNNISSYWNENDPYLEACRNASKEKNVLFTRIVIVQDKQQKTLDEIEHITKRDKENNIKIIIRNIENLSPVYRNLILRDIAIYDGRVLATMDERTINEKDERVTKCTIYANREHDILPPLRQFKILIDNDLRENELDKDTKNKLLEYLNKYLKDSSSEVFA